MIMKNNEIEEKFKQIPKWKKVFPLLIFLLILCLCVSFLYLKLFSPCRVMSKLVINEINNNELYDKNVKIKVQEIMNDFSKKNCKKYLKEYKEINKFSPKGSPLRNFALSGLVKDIIYEECKEYFGNLKLDTLEINFKLVEIMDYVFLSAPYFKNKKKPRGGIYNKGINLPVVIYRWFLPGSSYDNKKIENVFISKYDERLTRQLEVYAYSKGISPKYQPNEITAKEIVRVIKRVDLEKLKTITEESEILNWKNNIFKIQECAVIPEKEGGIMRFQCLGVTDSFAILMVLKHGMGTGKPNNSERLAKKMWESIEKRKLKNKE